MMRLFTLLFLTIPYLLVAQDRQERYMKWNAKKPLSWNDYEGKPDPYSDAAASTSTLLTISYRMSSAGFSYTIQSYFSKTKSWGLHKTPYILSHEQGHFDIAEIYARKLHKEMSEYKFNKRTYQKDFQKIYEKVTEEKSEMQNRYDKETNHSINKKKQADWLIKIESLLEEYEPWANY